MESVRRGTAKKLERDHSLSNEAVDYQLLFVEFNAVARVNVLGRIHDHASGG